LETLMKASALKDMPVVSMADGTRVGTVADVLLDAASLRVVALLLSADSGQTLLPFEAIRSIGADAVTIASAAATQGLTGRPAPEGTHSLRDVNGLAAVNGEGTLLGSVKEVEIEPADGRLIELVVHRGGVLGLGGTSTSVPASAIRGIGAKLVTVDLPAPSGDPTAP
jgi:sporulation protein YlmC with PRC-barrel domain